MSVSGYVTSHTSCTRYVAGVLLAAAMPLGHAQARLIQAPAGTSTAPASGAGTTGVRANLVIVPAVVFDKQGLVTTLDQGDFAISVNGKPQTLRYFGRDTDVPLTVGLLVDTSRGQETLLVDEQKASQTFLDSLLKPATPNRSADRAFVLQFAHSAELLQDVTDSRPLLAASLKEVGTQAPGSSDEESSQADNSNAGTSANGTGTPSGPGGYGHRTGLPGKGGTDDSGYRSQAKGGKALYDSVFLAADDVLSRQKGRRAMIVLTNGVDRHSKESLLEAIEAAQRADTVVYAIYLKGREVNDRDFGTPGGNGRYGGYGRPGYPGSGGRPGTDGTYAEPDGKKILQRICAETGGRLFELRGKASLDEIYRQIGDELRAQYRLGFTPSGEAADTGYHPVQISLTNPSHRKLELQTRDGYYTGKQQPQ